MSRTAALSLAEPRPWRSGLCWLAFLAPFFYLTYGAANAVTARRHDVGAIVFAWEHDIPFLAWTIIPYWSINAFYGFSLLVGTTRAELAAHVRRLVTAQIVAVTCFLAFPLRFTFPQPEAYGLPGFLFAALTSFDQPFNQAPSLHIALLVILWELYPRHLPRAVQWPLHAWFALVGLSVLTTYQHHLIDIPTGALLGLFCLWLWPWPGQSPLRTAAWPNDRRRLILAARYLTGALALAALAIGIGGAGLVLLWPAISLGLVAANYAVLGPEGFQKSNDGRMSLAARLLLAPYLAGAWINSRMWTRRAPKPVAVRDGVFLGRFPRAADTAGFAAIVDLAAELPGGADGRTWIAVPMLDLVVPSPALLRSAAASVERARSGGSVLVCCAVGYSRSAAVAATWLVASGRAGDADQAIEIIRLMRPGIAIDAALRHAIMAAAEQQP
jgi:protein-tyrosine phosphatase/membrane-associated phospholipid phosphatase